VLRDFLVPDSTVECEAYCDRRRAIDNANPVPMANYKLIYKSLIEKFYKSYLIQAQQLAIDAARSASATCASLPQTGTQLFCDDRTNNRGCGYSVTYPRSSCEFAEAKKITDSLQPQNFPLPPQLQTYPACSSPNCPPGKKVWVQVVWASPSGNFSAPKGCFIIAYSQDAPTLPPKIEYNPFLPEQFVPDRAISYYLVDGDRFRGLRDSDRLSASWP
jgi:hypothetical protein